MQSYIQKLFEKNHKNKNDGNQNDKSQRSGYFMMQATTFDSIDKIKAFYAVPESMRSNVEKDKSLLERSTNIKNLYEVKLADYLNKPKEHNVNAEKEFETFQRANQKVVSHVQKYTESTGIEKQRS